MEQEKPTPPPGFWEQDLDISPPDKDNNMRQFKFRAWNPKIGMSEIIELSFAHGVRLLPTDIDQGRNDLSDDQWVIMQTTGLADKNGKEMYEGDICLGSNGKKYQIVFHKGGFYCKNIVESTLISIGEFSDFGFLKIIGNIYET